MCVCVCVCVLNERNSNNNKNAEIVLQAETMDFLGWFAKADIFTSILALFKDRLV